MKTVKIGIGIYFIWIILSYYVLPSFFPIFTEYRLFLDTYHLPYNLAKLSNLITDVVFVVILVSAYYLTKRFKK